MRQSRVSPSSTPAASLSLTVTDTVTAQTKSWSMHDNPALGTPVWRHIFIFMFYRYMVKVCSEPPSRLGVGRFSTRLGASSADPSPSYGSSTSETARSTDPAQGIL